MGSLLPPFSVDVPRPAHPLQHSREAEDAEISKKLKYPGIIKLSCTAAFGCLQSLLDWRFELNREWSAQ
ncbi:MAG: hypothetical protein U1F19_09335 [Lysobacterales bacterium]